LTSYLFWSICHPGCPPKRDLLEAGINPWFSVASQWEISIKHHAGKLSFQNPEAFIPRHMEALKVTGLAVKSAHVLKTFALAPHHKDPFDRLLIAQALVEDCAIMTNDAHIVRYPVNIIW
jgi:PIN domain nuclease of toxin-antitoxin system